MCCGAETQAEVVTEPESETEVENTLETEAEEKEKRIGKWKGKSCKYFDFKRLADGTAGDIIAPEKFCSCHPFSAFRQ